MNLKAKSYEQAHKLAFEQKLAARLVILKNKGVADLDTQKDAVVKKIQADIRKTNHRLKSIAAREKLVADKVQAKADKLAAQQPASEPKSGSKKKPAAKAPGKEKKAKKTKEK